MPAVVSARIGEYQVESVHRAFGLFAIFVVRDRLGRTLWVAAPGQGITEDETAKITLRQVARTLANVKSDVPLRLVRLGEPHDGEAAGDELTYVAIEGPKGLSFEEIRDGREHDAAARLALGAKLASAVHELHQESLVGLALSQSTVFVVNGHVRISLLEALIRRREEASAKALTIRGSEEHYAAPELRRAAKATVASDVYTVARIVWELCGGTLTPPKRALGEGPTAEESLPNLGDAVDQRLATRALLRAMDPTATLRQPTARDLAADLRAALRGGSDGPYANTAEEPVRRLTTRLAPIGLAMLGLAVVAVSFGADTDVVPGTSVPRPGRVKLLAEPWADVFVNGERLDTTPIGRPVELPPGRYELTFRHPSAPEERRTLDLAPGAAVTIDVVMQIPSAAPPVVDDTP